MRELALQQPAHLYQMIHTRLQILHREWLFDKDVGSAVHTFCLAGIIGLCREHDEWQMTGLRIRSNTTAELRTIHFRHHPVAHYQRYITFVQNAQRLLAVFCRQHPIRLGEMCLHEVSHVLVIIHDQHRRAITLLGIFRILCG